MNKTEREKIISLVQRSVLPAVGCTEPVCVALCTARAKEVLESIPDSVIVELSANLIKNAMGVGVPGTGETGLPIAIALGVLMGDSREGLSLLESVKPQDVVEAKNFISQGRIRILEAKQAPDKLYVSVTAFSEGHVAKVIIAGHHTHFIRIEQDGKVILDEPIADTSSNESSDLLELTMSKVYEFATTAPLEEIEFIGEAAKLNRAIARNSLKGKYGHSVGSVMKSELAEDLLSNSIYRQMLVSTAGACDARMAGSLWPVMSNSGSGNQGICATNPVSVYAEKKHCSHEQTIRALMLSHLSAIHIKRHLGALSALCGCVVAGIGSACGLTYLMGGNEKQVCYAVQNMIANVTGMVCDGAKPACALKLSTGVSVAVMSALMAIENECVTSTEGIVDEDVEQSIRNMVRIGADAMNETDRCVLDIMTSKH